MYIVLGVVLIAGIILFAVSRTTTFSKVHLIDPMTKELVAAPGQAGQDYYLGVADSTINALTTERWFWQISRNDSIVKEFYDWEKPRFAAAVEGTYIIRAYVDMKEVARDTIPFTAGGQLMVKWPKGQATAGDVLAFEDRTAGITARQWTVTRRGDTLQTASGAWLEWEPDSAGEYRVQLRMAGSIDTLLERIINVREPIVPATEVAGTENVTEEPREQERLAETREPDPRPLDEEQQKPIKPQPDAPEPKKSEPKKPEPEPMETVDAGLACFAPADRNIGRSEPVAMPLPVPKRSDSELTWNASETVFEVVAERDCQLASFEWWAKSVGKGDATVYIECLETGCTGAKERKSAFQIQFDEYKPDKWEFPSRSLPVLRANSRYRIRVKPDYETAQMGHFRLPRTEYNEHGIKVNFLVAESAVFNIKFRTK